MNPTLNLICLPFAGGNKYSYRKYQLNAPSLLKIIPLEYPGRGSRIKEPLISDIEALVDDMYRQVLNHIDQKNYAIYGHSMGGLVGYLLTRKIMENNLKAPLHLFVTGASAPSGFSKFDKKRHLLPPREFIEKIKEFGGIPDEFLDSEDLLDYFDPILRADFKACENYQYENRTPLNIPITVITGTEEDLEIADLLQWQKETNCQIDFRQFPGKHFFIFQYPCELIEIITKKLSVIQQPMVYE